MRNRFSKFAQIFVSNIFEQMKVGFQEKNTKQIKVSFHKKWFKNYCTCTNSAKIAVKRMLGRVKYVANIRYVTVISQLRSQPKVVLET